MDDPSGNWPKWATIAIGAVVAVATSTVVTTAYAGDVAYSTVTGDSLLLNTVFQGNTEAYNTGLALTSVATGGMMEAAAHSPGVCFVEGTYVLGEYGYVEIQDICAGDMVWAENPETGDKQLKKVVQTFVNKTEELIHLLVNGEEIITTPEHPFYVSDKGWTEANELCVGDVLSNVNDEPAVVEKVQYEILESTVTVYNFEVEDFHTYYVGENAILVHNTCHNNSLKSTKKTDLYVLRDKNTNEVVKIGETTRGVMRYSRKFYNTNNVYMQTVDSGSKRAMHYQQHRWLSNYFSRIGTLPKLNKSFW